MGGRRKNPSSSRRKQSEEFKDEERHTQSTKRTTTARTPDDEAEQLSLKQFRRLVKDQDVWLGGSDEGNTHPGTRDLKRAIRYSVEEFPGDDYSKRVYNFLRQQLKIAKQERKFYIVDGPSSKHVKEASREELFEEFGNYFEKEQNRQLQKKQKRALQRIEETKKSRSNPSLLREDHASQRIEETKKSRSNPSLLREDRMRSSSSDRESQGDWKNKSGNNGNRPMSPGREGKLNKKISSKRIQESVQRKRGDDEESVSIEWQQRSRTRNGEEGTRMKRGKSNQSFVREEEGLDGKVKISRSEASLKNRASRDGRPATESQRQSSTTAPKKRASRSNRDGDLSRLEEGQLLTSENDEDERCLIFLDKKDHPGTTAFYETVKNTIMEHEGSEYNSNMYKIIKKEMKGRIFYRSKEDYPEEPVGSKHELAILIEECCDEERVEWKKLKKVETYMSRHARKRDVYFSVPAHPGTHAWRKVVQKIAQDNPQTVYGKLIYKEIVEQLEGRDFYVKEPPKCREASNPEATVHCGECFDEEKQVIANLNQSQVVRRRRKGANRRGGGGGGNCDSTISVTDSTRDDLLGGDASRVKRKVPGTLVWARLGAWIRPGERISTRLAKWAWYQRFSSRVSGLPVVVRTYSTYQRFSARVASWPIVVRTSSALNREPGQDVFDKIFVMLNVTAFGYSSSWPSVIMLAILCVLCIVWIVLAIMRNLMSTLAI
jgi:hypothetical protein